MRWPYLRLKFIRFLILFRSFMVCGSLLHCVSTKTEMVLDESLTFVKSACCCVFNWFAYTNFWSTTMPTNIDDMWCVRRCEQQRHLPVSATHFWFSIVRNEPQPCHRLCLCSGNDYKCRSKCHTSDVSYAENIDGISVRLTVVIDAVCSITHHHCSYTSSLRSKFRN